MQQLGINRKTKFIFQKREWKKSETGGNKNCMQQNEIGCSMKQLTPVQLIKHRWYVWLSCVGCGCVCEYEFFVSGIFPSQNLLFYFSFSHPTFYMWFAFIESALAVHICRTLSRRPYTVHVELPTTHIHVELYSWEHLQSDTLLFGWVSPCNIP